MLDNLIYKFITSKTVVVSFPLSGYNDFARSLTPHIRCTRAVGIYTSIGEPVQIPNVFVYMPTADLKSR